MVVGKLSVSGHPTNLDHSRAIARLLSVQDVKDSH